MVVRRLLTAIVLLATGLLGACSDAPAAPPCQPSAEAESGWASSFVAGCLDRNGHYLGGSQTMHLVAHKGQLYAAIGYWEDARNVWYGGPNPATGWGQILRLSAPGAPWVVDLELGPRHLRPELLTSVTFTTDAAGRTLPEPATVLLAAAYDGSGESGIHLFRRDDATGTWVRSEIVRGSTGHRGEDNSVRKAIVHRDRVTGRDDLFLSVGVVGLFRADYDPGRPGVLAWSDTPEYVPTSTRILGLTQADGSLFVSDGSHVMRRIDGAVPRYEEIADFTGEIDPATPRKAFSAIGGIRGLTAIPGPVAGRQSLLLMWNPGSRSRGCVIRLDPTPQGHWLRRPEVCLADLAARRLGVPVGYMLGAYNGFIPLADRDSGTAYFTGIEAFLVGPPTQPLIAYNQRKAGGGFYAGALYALRDPQGHWRLGEVNGRFDPGRRELVSIYTAAISPFGASDAGRVYVGGYDPNDFPSTDTAWIASAALRTLLAH
jgi:hypothetical protein